MSLRDLDVLQNLLLTGNKYLIKVHFFLVTKLSFHTNGYFENPARRCPFYLLYFLKAHKMFVLNILISAQAQVLEL